MASFGVDFQHANYNYIVNEKSQLPHPRGTWVTDKNLVEIGVYFAVRHVIPATWLNDRDQFLFPNEKWKEDKEFQTDCLIYTLFNNNIQSKQGTNYWIPFTEAEVGAQESFESHFMNDFLNGKLIHKKQTEKSTTVVYPDTFKQQDKVEKLTEDRIDFIPLEHLSAEAQTVMEAGRKLWCYYHAQPNANPDASFYDIRLHFQGYITTKSGKIQMNPDSQDKKYKDLIKILREALKELATVIAPKVYEYGFLLK